jgi:RNA-binding protein
MLNSRQRSLLSGLAQNTDAFLSLGKAGATPELAERLAVLLGSHELVKLRFAGFKESRRELAFSLAERTGSELVRIIGNVAVFWKANPDPEKRKIDLGT